jgi:hypothetical protein
MAIFFLGAIFAVVPEGDRDGCEAAETGRLARMRRGVRKRMARGTEKRTKARKVRKGEARAMAEKGRAGKAGRPGMGMLWAGAPGMENPRSNTRGRKEGGRRPEGGEGEIRKLQGFALLLSLSLSPGSGQTDVRL